MIFQDMKDEERLEGGEILLLGERVLQKGGGGENLFSSGVGGGTECEES